MCCTTKKKLTLTFGLSYFLARQHLRVSVHRWPRSARIALDRNVVHLIDTIDRAMSEWSVSVVLEMHHIYLDFH